MNRADTIDWMVAAHEVASANGLALSMYLKDILSTLTMMTQAAPYVAPDHLHLFESCATVRDNELGVLFTEAEPVSGKVFITSVTERSTGFAASTVVTKDYLPGANYARYHKELDSYLAQLELGDKDVLVATWCALLVFMSGNAGAYDATWRFLIAYHYSSKDPGRKARLHADSAITAAAKLAGKTAASSRHPYLETLAELACAHQVKHPAALSLQGGLPVFGL